MLRTLKRDQPGTVLYVVNYHHASSPTSEKYFDNLVIALEFHEKMSKDEWCSFSQVRCIEVMTTYRQRNKMLDQSMRR